MTEVFIRYDKCKNDQYSHGVFIVETIGEIVIASTRAEKSQQGYAS